jgi:hypothetical protein
MQNEESEHRKSTFPQIQPHSWMNSEGSGLPMGEMDGIKPLLVN